MRRPCTIPDIRRRPRERRTRRGAAGALAPALLLVLAASSSSLALAGCAQPLRIVLEVTAGPALAGGGKVPTQNVQSLHIIAHNEAGASVESDAAWSGDARLDVDTGDMDTTSPMQFEVFACEDDPAVCSRASTAFRGCSQKRDFADVDHGREQPLGVELRELADPRLDEACPPFTR